MWLPSGLPERFLVYIHVPIMSKSSLAISFLLAVNTRRYLVAFGLVWGVVGEELFESSLITLV